MPENICEMNGGIYMPAAQTYGRDANSILREVMKVSERPTDIKQRMNLFYSYMDENNYKECSIDNPQCDRKYYDQLIGRRACTKHTAGNKIPDDIHQTINK